MILLPLVLFVVVVSATSDCLELGFSNPSCSICTDLQKYIPGTTEIYQKCKECCIPEPGSNEKYTSAELIMCNCKEDAFPHITSFIRQERKARKFKNLKLTHRPGAYPTLKLVKEDGSHETRAIDLWKTEHLEEFFQTKFN
eukprot:TRINITY_DN6180_c0_g2_i2.p1 TRINITY_DN6180_c0_g2~~TRINITY_DN6180_c0_g2_i2.p1  ORF type:complete len:157 (-),score=31.54 TRINITY_DN6180_c0_g2_i2:73-495(-)